MTRWGRAVLLAGMVCGGLQGAVAQATAGTVGSGPGDAAIQKEVLKALNNKRFRDVTAAVNQGTVDLTGTVRLYSDKEEADQKVHHRKGVQAVENQITVAGPVVEDATLRAKLGEKLVYDRVGYGTTAFNAFTIGVHDGVVTLGGVAYGPVDKSSALGLVASYPGVKDVVDNIEVAPVSPMDDRIRLAEARTIYGYPRLNRYALDPAKPIRITVINGNVTLSGVVDTEADKEVAGLQANTVPGVFKVTNDLEVARGSGSKEPSESSSSRSGGR